MLINAFDNLRGKQQIKSSLDTYAIWVFGVALLIRIGVMLASGNDYSGASLDENIFDTLAVSLTAGSGLSYPAEKGKQYKADPMPYYLRLWAEESRIYGVVKTDAPTSFWPPGYPVFLSLVYRLFGHNMLVARLIGGLLGSLACMLVYFLARSLTPGRGPALLAGLFAAIHPPLVLYSVALQAEGLFVLLFLLVLWAYFQALQANSLAVWPVAVGALSGAAFLTRPIGLVIAFGCMICWLIQNSGKKRALGCAAQLAAFLLVITPWVARNYLVHDQLVILPTQGGYNAWVYSARYFDTDLPDEVVGAGEADLRRIRSIVNFHGGDIDRLELTKFPEFYVESEIERDKILRQRSLAFLRANPRLLLGLIYYRVIDLFDVTPSSDGNQVARMAVAFSTTVLLLFGFLGAAISLRSAVRRFLAVYVLIAMYLCAASITMGSTRARVPIDGFLCLFGAVFLAWCRGKFKLALWPIHKTPSG